MSPGRERTAAENVALGVSLAIVLAVLAAIGVVAATQSGSEGPQFAVEIGDVRGSGGEHHVQVRVRNTGDATAENVQVRAELAVPGGPPLEAEQHIDFLAAGGEAQVTFVFAEEPVLDRLTVEVASYRIPWGRLSPEAGSP
jgi:uncharacterized protein (TIGR02588 family)